MFDCIQLWLVRKKKMSLRGLVSQQLSSAFNNSPNAWDISIGYRISIVVVPWRKFDIRIVSWLELRGSELELWRHAAPLLIGLWNLKPESLKCVPLANCYNDIIHSLEDMIREREREREREQEAGRIVPLFLELITWCSMCHWIPTVSDRIIYEMIR